MYHGGTRHGESASDVRDLPTRYSDHTSSSRHHRDHTSPAPQQRTLTPSASLAMFGVESEKNGGVRAPTRVSPSSPPDVQLQRSRLKVKRLEKEVRKGRGGGGEGEGGCDY